jgi:hypothetical protein
MGTRRIRLRTLLGIGAISVCTVVFASTNSPVQSTVPPYFGTLIGKVQLANSDTQAQAYGTMQAGFISQVKTLLPETVAFTGKGLTQLDPQRIYFMYDYAPRVYFLYEYTGGTNQLGVTIGSMAAPVTGAATGTTYTLFPLCQSNSNGIRTTSNPLQPGDFVQLPMVQAGQQLSFCMTNCSSNGVPLASWGGGAPAVFYNGVSSIDNIGHMIAYEPDSTSQYIVVGFEDWAFYDNDCNDCVVVIDIGPQNAAVLRNPNTLPK